MSAGLRIALLLPPGGLDAADLRQRLAGIACRFPGCLVDEIQLPPEDVNLAAYDHLVVCDDKCQTPLPDHHARVYRVSAMGRVLPLADTPIDDRELPSIDRHPFSRSAPRGQGDLDYASFHYFPYGYLYRLVGLGPINEFGHRITEDIRSLKQRDPRHKVIACFGGSAVWGVCVIRDQSFPFQLQEILNGNPELSAAVDRCTVLNFGIPGGVVLNAMQHFLLFCADIRPDIVICHDGVNDIFYGCTSDPWLLGEHGIVYQQQLEYWADMLHDKNFKGNANLGGPVVPPSGLAPVRILQAYARRKVEFMTVARAFGAKFIWGQQGFAWSKPLSPIERARISPTGAPSAYEKEFHTVRLLYDLLRPRLEAFKPDALVDFDTLFSGLSSFDTVMADMVHLDPAGERLVAEHYARAIAGML
ncbi:MAG TPA: SGNH/GDSL hydrolase family protein [Magnetospirillum sp.]|nr:SGNH/GDSL hydrolase family protein [Magnetospirillum sp.]